MTEWQPKETAMEQNKIDAVNALQSELKYYLSDYGLDVVIDEVEGVANNWIVYTDIMDEQDCLKHITFTVKNPRFNKNDDEYEAEIYIHVYEDCEEKINWWDNSCKYFWMTFLDWPKPRKQV